MTTETQTHTEVAPAPDTKPKVSKDTKFQKRGFKSSDEVEQDGLSKGEVPPSDLKASAEQVEASPKPEEGLPEEFVFKTPDETQTPEDVKTEGTKVAPEAEEDEAGYTIGDKHFKTQKEAFAYAEELRLQQLANDAFRQGIEAAHAVQNSNISPEKEAAKAPEKMPDEYYLNPEVWWTKERQRLAEESKKIADQARSQAIQEIQRQETHNRTMSKFWNDYPDLAKNQATQKLAQRVLAENFQRLGNMKTEEALKLVAQKAREELRELGVTTLPQKTMPSSTKPASSPGNGINVTRPKTDEKPLNFVQQLKQARSRRTGLSKR